MGEGRLNESGGCDCDPIAAHGMDCPVIRDIRAGASKEGKAAFMKEYHEECRKRAAILENGGDARDSESALRKAGVPANVLAWVRDHRENLATDAVTRFLQSPRTLATFLMLSGPPGVGKSVAAGVCCREWLKKTGTNNQPSGNEQRAHVLWVAGSKIAGVAGWVGGESVLLSQMRRAGLLVIDELGREGSEAGNKAIAEILLDRHARHAPTVLTGNIRKDAIPGRYGDPVADRLRESAIWPDLTKLHSQRKTGDRR